MRHRSRHTALPKSAICAAVSMLCGFATAAPLNLSSNPLFLTSTSTPNVLVLYGNANSMDEAANGSAVGSASPESKSEIARNAIKVIMNRYRNSINMGLMAYQQYVPEFYHLGSSQYDVSYDPRHYDPTFVGARNSQTKKYRIENPKDPGKYIYYNVALPFYTDEPFEPLFQWSDTACTSPTRDFFGVHNGQGCTNNREVVGNDMNSSGPWDVYYNFTGKTGTSNSRPLSSGAGYTGSLPGYRTWPTNSDLAQGITDFGTRNAMQYVGPTWFANTSPGKGFIHQPIAPLDDAQIAALDKKLATSQFTDNMPVDPSYPLQNSGLTPIEGAVITATDYFNGNLNGSKALEGGPLPAPPNSCGKNFLVMLTDGLPSATKDGNPIANVAQSLTDVTTQVRAALASPAQIRTYEVGFALPYGVNPSQLDIIAAAGGTGTAYYATDPATLGLALDGVFTDLLARVSSSASLAANSTSLNAGTTVYQARFDSTGWSGDLLAYPVNTNGQTGATPTWSASAQLGSISPTARAILSYDASIGSAVGGFPFRWASLPASFETALRTNVDGSSASRTVGEARLDWFRGVRSAELGNPGGYLRTRTSVLGDIINSNPVYVGKPVAGWPDADYAAFATTYKSRAKVVYVGSNDGMLHGFDADTGAERLAYIPGSIVASSSVPPTVSSSNLTHLATQPYQAHRYYVDGSPTVSDAKFGLPAQWGSVLVGGLGAGGRAVYALDVTDPSRFTEANASSLALWEFNADIDPDLGYTFGQPSIVRLANGRWAAMFGNGYNSANNNSYLFLVFLDRVPGSKIWVAGTDYLKIPTGGGNSALANGLSSPVATDVNSDGIVDFVYAGDLQGNMWKFDLRGASTSAWGNRFGAGVALYTATGPSGTVQPIIGAPEVIRNPAGGYNILFGTGMYLQAGTADTLNTDIQSFYSIRDANSATPLDAGRDNLQQQSIIGEVTELSGQYRITTDTVVNYATKDGWYMDLLSPAGAALGERVIYQPMARNGRIIFTTLTPSTATCSYGGSSWLMELDALNGSRLSVSPFDVNSDGTFTSADYVAWNSLQVPVSGRRSTIGITPRPTVVQNPDNPNKEHKLFSGTSGNTESVSENATGSSGRLSWRQIQN